MRRKILSQASGRHSLPTAIPHERGVSKMKRLVLAAAFATLGITAVLAQSDPIAARKAIMKENGNQSRIAREMVEGKQPFNLDAAKKVFATFGGTADKVKNLFP